MRRYDPKEFAKDQQHGTEILRPQSLTAHLDIIDLAANETTERA